MSHLFIYLFIISPPKLFTPQDTEARLRPSHADGNQQNILFKGLEGNYEFPVFFKSSKK